MYKIDGVGKLADWHPEWETEEFINDSTISVDACHDNPSYSDGPEHSSKRFKCRISDI